MIPAPEQNPAATNQAALPLLVLDTNVCLDLFVFDDMHTRPIMAALQAGQVRAITRSDCRDEWLAVLHYRHLPLNDENRPQAIAMFDRYIEVINPTEKGTRLPACSDKDDQKFLQVARDAQADFLITKDKALLKCAKKTAQAGLFTIILPKRFALASTTVASS